MLLIYANRPGTPIAPVRALTREEIQALQRAITGETSRQSQILMRTARQQRWWFACNCRGPTATRPMLYVHRSPSGELVLANMPDRPAHGHGCVFGRANRTAQKGRASSLESPPTLRDLFFRWFSAAKLNVVYPYSPRDVLGQQFASLRDVSRSLRLAAGRTLYDFSRTHVEALPNLIRKLQQAGPDPREADADGDRCWGVMLLVTEGAKTDGIAAGASISSLAADVVESTAAEANVNGPYAVLLKYRADAAGAARLCRTFVQPIHSSYRLVPISAAQERRTLTTLLGLQQKLLAERSVLMVIRKTLPATPAYDRGIAFHLNRIGPNGRSVHEVDVVSVDASNLAPMAKPAPCPQDVIYHLVKSGTACHELDRHFFNIAYARLVDGVAVGAQHDR